MLYEGIRFLYISEGFLPFNLGTKKKSIQPDSSALLYVKFLLTSKGAPDKEQVQD